MKAVQTVTISGREYPVFVTFGVYERLLKMYPDFHDKITTWPTEKYNKYIIDALWLILRRRYGVKPFFFKFRLPGKITLSEMKYFQLNFAVIFYGKEEDGEEDSLGK